MAAAEWPDEEALGIDLSDGRAAAKCAKGDARSGSAVCTG